MVNAPVSASHRLPGSVSYVAVLCRRMLEAGTPGLHMYTLNLEGGAVTILERLGLIDKSKVCSPPHYVNTISLFRQAAGSAD